MGGRSVVLEQVEDGVLTLTLNRPDRLNAMNAELGEALIASFDRADRDDDVRAVIVTGAGRAFCAGADLSSGTNSFVVGGGPGVAIDYADPAIRDLGGTVTLRIFRSLKPVIAAVNGDAVGFGATIQLAMDVRLASTRARYGFVFARRGIVPEAASTWFLPRIVGISRALEWCMTGRLLPAAEALGGGLVRSVHEPDDLLPAARALARSIADGSAPVSVALTRQMMWRMLGAADPFEAHRLDSWAVAARALSGDAAEGIASFIEKRPAAFPDRVSSDMPDF